MNRILGQLAGLRALLGTAPPTQQGDGEARVWEPGRIWVFVVGALEWKHADIFSPFPEKLRRDALLVDFFRAQGVPAQQLVYLQDQQTTLRQVERAFRDMLAKTRAGDALFVYYCGHGYKGDDGKGYFASYDAGDDEVIGWAMDSVPAMIEAHFQGERAVLAADCCCSGSLVDATKKHAKRVSFACFGSSLANETSTGNWTFTEGLLAGLRGDAFIDAHNDGEITLQDLADQIKEDMAFAEEQRTTFAVTGTFTPGVVLTSAGRKAHPRVGERVEVLSGGKWYKARIIDAGKDGFLVHYYGWDSDSDEWVGEDQIRVAVPVQYAVGTAVEVKWKGDWYPAEVLKVRGGVHLIHYEGYDSSSDEWVPSKRMRPRGTG